jgi:hypothetical protein
MSFTRVVRFGFSAMAVLGVVLTASPTWAQDPPVVVATGAVDFTNQYNFRGIRQNTDGVAIQPFVDFGFTPYKGDGSLKTLGLNVGTWNSFHSQIDGFTNIDGEITDNKWYESDLYATLAFGFQGATLGMTYTSYMSPDQLFSHVKELLFKVSGPAQLGGVALGPYGLIAFELSDDGQADAGAEKGKYVELGIAPGYAGTRASLTFPVKVGLSAGDYYEFGSGEDSKFGFFSLAGLVTVPMGPHANIHGGLEFQVLGDNLEVYAGEDTMAIGSIGLGFAF